MTTSLSKQILHNVLEWLRISQGYGIVYGLYDPPSARGTNRNVNKPEESIYVIADIQEFANTLCNSINSAHVLRRFFVLIIVRSNQ